MPGLAIVGDLVRDRNAGCYELRKDFKTEMIGRRDPAGPAIVCIGVNMRTRRLLQTGDCWYLQ